MPLASKKAATHVAARCWRGTKSAKINQIV